MIIQRTDEWFAARLGKATASNFFKIMAGDRYATWKNYRAELVAERLTGKKSDTYQSAEMLWGVENEPLARLHYLLRSKNKVEECGFFEHETLAAGASPDGLINGDGVLEIKCPNTATHLETLHSGQVPKQYVPQVQGQIWLTKRKQADFVSFDPRLPENANIIIINVKRDDDYIKKMESEIVRFLKEVEAECDFVRNYGKVKQ